MKICILSAVVVMTFAAGCTTASGPTHNVEAVKLSNSREGWGVHCHGLFESSKTCFKLASKVCGEKPVQVNYAFDRPESGLSPKEDARDFVFTCGVSTRSAVDTPTSVGAGLPRSLR
ncbi:hypothetical protein NH14_002855 [Paraburkholderia sacchari]|uniref:Lipoprotein n=1 Tax=Paraburkholderia sacchari TaxID=159450 RepID=A0A8T6Z7A1_9BURK|nr:hypothetical protein [Paraburkholderia sacchari]